jgi:hypothetical protein
LTPAAPPAAAPAPTGAAAPTAKGEAKYGDAWVTLEDLFKDYLAARTELQGWTAKVDAAREKLNAIQRRLNTMKTESAAAERPIRVELGKANNKRREYNKALSQKQPQKPVLLALPPPPRQTMPSTSTRRYGSSSYGGSSSSYDTDSSYQNAVRDWEARCDVIKRQNDQATQKYQREMAEYKKEQEEAKKELPKIEATIKACEAKLEASAKELETKQAPTVEEAKAANEEVATIQRQMLALETRLKNLTDALKASSETLRHQHGIVEWEGLFYTAAELEKLCTDTQAEISKVHEQLAAEAAKSGQPLPPNWRHPQQDRMDALKAILDKVKAVQASAPKPAA